MTLEELQIYKNEIANHRELSQEVMAELFDLAEVALSSPADEPAIAAKKPKKSAAPAPVEAPAEPAADVPAAE